MMTKTRPIQKNVPHSDASTDTNELSKPTETPFRVFYNGYHIDMTLRDKLAVMDYLWKAEDDETIPVAMNEEEESSEEGLDFDMDLFGSCQFEERAVVVEEEGDDDSDDDGGEATRPSIVVRNWWKLANPKKGLEGIKPCEDALAIWNEPNAGGKSINSEALSMEMMSALWGGHEVVTEMEVEYWNESWTKCDYMCSVPSKERELVAVSVTRAMWYPHPSGFNRDEARRLLKKKLHGLIVARQGIMGKSFRKSVLHVWCETEAIADEVQLVYETLISDSLKGDIVVLLSIAEDAPYVFYDYEDTIYIRPDRSISEPIRLEIIKRKREQKKKMYLRAERSLSI
jgi:hypothetical protein